MRAEQVTDPIAYHAEGPVWSPSWGGLRWVDMLAGDVLTLAADGSVGRRHVGDVVAVLRPRRTGGTVLAVERGFAVESADGELTTLAPVWADPGVRMNEGGCDPDGRFWCGSMAYDQRAGAAAMYRLDPDLTVTRVFGGLTISNGLAWSPGGTRAYYNDTPTHQIASFDYVPRIGLTGRRTFVDLTAEGASPDGLCVADDGSVWTALNGSSVVRGYDRDGRQIEEIELPVRQVTACAFGGPNLTTLYVTTSREGLTPDDEPLAGALFAVELGVAGLPVAEFAG